MLELLRTFSWQELCHHPWRHGAALLAIMLGVALAYSVHLINTSALNEFSQAVQSVNGEPDLSLRAPHGDFDEQVFAKVVQHPLVKIASPVLEVSTQTLDPMGQALSLRVLGVDALRVAGLTPALRPLLAPDVDRLAVFAPNTVFLNPAAQQRLGDPDALQVQSGLSLKPLQVAGRVVVNGAPLAIMDIGAAQDFFGKTGQVTRIDIRLREGARSETLMRDLTAGANWPNQVRALVPADSVAQIGNMSRAYRVNLTVLALIALFTGAFLVFSVLSLSVSQRAPQLALLGVLGLSARHRLAVVLWEATVMGAVGSALGIALGLALAAMALSFMNGDLGGAYFNVSSPGLQWRGSSALLYLVLGVLAALLGAWWPARQAQQLPLAATLKGLGASAPPAQHRWLSLLLMAFGVALTAVPPLFDLPLAAYLSVGLLLVGGIGTLPWLVGGVLNRVVVRLQRRPLALLAVERARHQRNSAAVALSGVVASLSLAVALTVMVASFRQAVTQWLDVILPADLYVSGARTARASESVYLPAPWIQAAAQLPGVQRIESQRIMLLGLAAGQAAVTLIARELDDPARRLPLVGAALRVPDGQIGIYVSEAVVALHGAQPGEVFEALSTSFAPLLLPNTGGTPQFFVAGVWRDYARQAGALAVDKADFERLTGDRRSNQIALWLNTPQALAGVQQSLRVLADTQSAEAGQLLDIESVSQIRAHTLQLFDRSFAVTYWLQAVAIGIGLFGVAASFSAQVLSRRKEFGLLSHLGLSRTQILTIVAYEGAAWTALAAIAGLTLGLAVAAILVHIVNPQSFHWTMELLFPWWRLLGLCVAVIVCGTFSAWFVARTGVGRDAVLAVKEDW